VEQKFHLLRNISFNSFLDYFHYWSHFTIVVLPAKMPLFLKGPLGICGMQPNLICPSLSPHFIFPDFRPLMFSLWRHFMYLFSGD